MVSWASLLRNGRTALLCRTRGFSTTKPMAVDSAKPGGALTTQWPMCCSPRLPERQSHAHFQQTRALSLQGAVHRWNFNTSSYKYFNSPACQRRQVSTTTTTTNYKNMIKVKLRYNGGPFTRGQNRTQDKSTKQRSRPAFLFSRARHHRLQAHAGPLQQLSPEQPAT